jgi:hypothetical protein
MPPPIPTSGSVPKWKSQPTPRSGLELAPPQAPCRSHFRNGGSPANLQIPSHHPSQVVLLQSLLSPFLRSHPLVPRVLLSPTPASPLPRAPAEARARNDGQEAGGVSMNLGLEMGVQRLAVAAQRSPAVAPWADHLPGAGFPRLQTQVAAINVDTAGREVPLSGQKGICVQWR